MADTGAQVAEAAGVSVATVSRVFSSPDIVRPETRDRVLAAAERLGYTPKRGGRPAASRRTMSIGVVVPNLSNPYFADIVKAVQARARQKGYATTLADSDEHEPDERELALEMAGSVDGLVMVSARTDEPVLQEIAAHVPTVLANRTAAGVSSVLAPSLPGTLQAIEHLHSLGHRRCCYVDGGRESAEVLERQAAIKERCAQLGLEFVELGYFPVSFESGVAVTSLVLATGATSVLVYNDLIALGIVAKLAEDGVLVPRDISVVGAGDTLLASSCNPPLTSVHVPLRDIGRRSVDLLLDRLADPDAKPQDVELGSSFVVRSSTARPKTS